MRAIFWKEMADHFGRRRFLLLFGLVVMGTLWGVLVDTDQLVRQGDGFFFLDLFTTRISIPISLLSFISLFGPVIGITLGFDSINSERVQGTLARVLAQPVYRDAVFNGKFLAGLVTLSIVVLSMGISVVGLGMFRIGMAPAGEEVIRLIGFGSVTIAYLAFWLALAMTASVVLRNTVTSALVSIGLWITLISVAPERLQGLLATPVSAGQSLQLVWPHIVALVAMVGALVAVSYTKFMREEIRA